MQLDVSSWLKRYQRPNWEITSGVIEEADESEFWIDMGNEFDLLRSEDSDDLKKEAYELASIYITTRKSLSKGN